MNLYIPSIAIDLIKKHEGFSSKIYICPAGYRTIGYGHVIQDADNFVSEIAEDEAHALLIEDLDFYLAAVLTFISVRLNETQLAALLSFTFNLGSGALQRSTLRQKLNRYEYLPAADEFLRWIYAKGFILPGLVRRRVEERNIFLSVR